MQFIPSMLTIYLLRYGPFTEMRWIAVSPELIRLKKPILSNFNICILIPHVLLLYSASSYTEDSEKTRANLILKELQAMKAVSHLPQFPTLIGYVDSFPYRSIIMEYLADPFAPPCPLTLQQVLKNQELTDSQIIKVKLIGLCLAISWLLARFTTPST